MKKIRLNRDEKKAENEKEKREVVRDKINKEEEEKILKPIPNKPPKNPPNSNLKPQTSNPSTPPPLKSKPQTLNPPIPQKKNKNPNLKTSYLPLTFLIPLPLQPQHPQHPHKKKKEHSSRATEKGSTHPLREDRATKSVV